MQVLMQVLWNFSPFSVHFTCKLPEFR